MRKSKNSVPARLCLAVLVLLSICLIQLDVAFAADGRQNADNRLELQAACKRNLHLIFDAIQRYRNDNNGKVPEGIHQLHGQYISDLNVCICPLALATQDYKFGAAGFRNNFGFDWFSTYNYEFNAKDRESLWDKSKRLGSEQDYKIFTMKTPVGTRVPIVRCLQKHSRRLNLSYNGRIFESDRDWEPEVRGIFPQTYLLPDYVFADQRPIPKRANPRDPVHGDRQLDISGSFNAMLRDSWSNGFRNYHLRELEKRLESSTIFRGVEFDVRGIIQVDGKLAPRDIVGFKSPLFPPEVRGIPVNATCEKLSFLHGALFEAPSGSVIGWYILKYVDKTDYS